MSFLSRVNSFFNFRVTHWHIATKGWSGEEFRVLADLHEDIWYWAIAYYLAWEWLTRICNWLEFVPLPKFICNWKRNWGGDPDECVTQLDEYYGEDLSPFWHCWIESPICQWAFRNKYKTGHTLEFE